MTQTAVSNKLNLRKEGDGQNTDPQYMDYPNGLPKWTTLKWTTPILFQIIYLHSMTSMAFSRHFD